VTPTLIDFNFEEHLVVTEIRSNNDYQCWNMFRVSWEVEDKPSELQHRDMTSVLFCKH
jgi:hypothetical protein